MRYSKCLNVDIFFKGEKKMLTNGIILAISGQDILRRLGIQFTPSTSSVCGTKYHKQCISVLDQGLNGSRVDPKWLFVKVVAWKGCIERWDIMIGWIGDVLHHL